MSEPVQRRLRKIAGGRKKRYGVDVDPSTDAVLQRMAAEQRVTVQRLLVESALHGGGEANAARQRDLEELFRVSRSLATPAAEVARIGNNLNQIARQLNTDGSIANDTRATLDAVRETLEVLRRAAEGVEDFIDGYDFGVQA